MFEAFYMMFLDDKEEAEVISNCFAWIFFFLNQGERVSNSRSRTKLANRKSMFYEMWK